MIRRRSFASLSLSAFVSALAIAVMLTGCSAAAANARPAHPSDSKAPSASATSSSSARTSESPTINPTDAVNATTVLPPDFPPQVPLIEGDIVAASKTSRGWVAWVSSKDPIAGYQEASTALQDAGFTASADQSINGSAGGVFTDDQFTVTVSAGAGAQYPRAVGYQIDSK